MTRSSFRVSYVSCVSSQTMWSWWIRWSEYPLTPQHSPTTSLLIKWLQRSSSYFPLSVGRLLRNHLPIGAVSYLSADRAVEGSRSSHKFGESMKAASNQLHDC